MECPWRCPVAAVLLIGPLIGQLSPCFLASIDRLGKNTPIIANLGCFGVYRAAIFLLLGEAGFSGIARHPWARGQHIYRWGSRRLAAMLLLCYLVGWLIIRVVTALARYPRNRWQRGALRLALCTNRQNENFLFRFLPVCLGRSRCLYFNVCRYRNVVTSDGVLARWTLLSRQSWAGLPSWGVKANLLGSYVRSPACRCCGRFSC